MGTGDAVFSVVNDLYGARDRGETVAACFLDVRKAFDSIHHGELLSRLKLLGIPPIYTNWFHAYLANRSQKVLSNNKLSASKPIPFGVPQGSILGPLLFICYINNLPNVLQHCSISMYADDVVFYINHKSSVIAENLLQLDANRIYNWFSASGLCINTDKTEIVMFNSNSPDQPTIEMGGTVLNVKDEYEYLGVTIDNKLNFIKSVSKTISTASLRIYLLSKIRKMLPKKTACIIYKQTVMPVIEYCGFLFNGLTGATCKRLQRVQNRGLRVCLKTNMKHLVADLHKECNVDYVDVRFNIQLLMLVHKYLYSEVLNAEQIGLILKKPNIAGRTTRSANSAELVYPQDNKLSYRKSPLYRAVDLWNALPSSCRLNPDKISFKKNALVHVRAWSAAKRLRGG